MWTDPIVEEVRKYRREIEEECDNSFDKLYNRIKKREKQNKNRIVTKPIKRTATKRHKTAKSS